MPAAAGVVLVRRGRVAAAVAAAKSAIVSDGRPVMVAGAWLKKDDVMLWRQ